MQSLTSFVNVLLQKSGCANKDVMVFFLILLRHEDPRCAQASNHKKLDSGPLPRPAPEKRKSSRSRELVLAIENFLSTSTLLGQHNSLIAKGFPMPRRKNADLSPWTECVLQSLCTVLYCTVLYEKVDNSRPPFRAALPLPPVLLLLY